MRNKGYPKVYSAFGGVQSTPRIMRGIAPRSGVIWDVPLEQRHLGEDVEVDMPAECARPGEIMLSPGVCGPDTHRAFSPSASAPPTSSIPLSTTRASSPTLLAVQRPRPMSPLLVVGAVVTALYFLSKG